VTNVIARFSSLTPSGRFRAVGMLVLVLGITAACVFYLIEARAAAPALDASFPDDAQAQARQIGIMMGTFGVILLGWGNALQRPGMQAVVIAGGSVFVAFVCYRIAWVLEYNKRMHEHTGDGT
jgi:hypothetical protein